MEITKTKLRNKQQEQKPVHPTPKKSLNILLVGNNPIELNELYDTVRKSRAGKMHAEICFNVNDSFEKSIKLRPDCIVADENLTMGEIREMVDKIKSDVRTQDIPFVLLTQRTYKRLNIEVSETLNKKDFSPEKLSYALLKSVQEKQTVKAAVSWFQRWKRKVSIFFFNLRDRIVSYYLELKKFFALLFHVNPEMES